MFDNPTISAVIGAAAGSLLSILCALYLARRRRSFRRIDCVISEATSLLAFSDKIKDNLQITFLQNKVQAVYLISLCISNSGTEAVTNQPIKIRLSEGARIVDYSCKTEPPVGFGAIRNVEQHSHVLDLEAALINPGDKIWIELVSIDNPDEAIDVYLKNANVRTRVFYSHSLMDSTVLGVMGNPGVLFAYAFFGRFPVAKQILAAFVGSDNLSTIEEMIETGRIFSYRQPHTIRKKSN